MVNKIKIVIEEVFIAADSEKRKYAFQEIMLNVIKKTEVQKSA